MKQGDDAQEHDSGVDVKGPRDSDGGMRSLTKLRGLAVLALALPAVGCTESSSSDHPTYYEDVAPIIQAHCTSCHSGHGIGPFPLVSYSDVKGEAAAIKSATASRTMPPYHIDASGDCNRFKDARVLSNEEIATLGKWADNGAAEGDPKNAPPRPAAPAKLAKVDRSLDPGTDYLPNTSESDDYRCFIIDPGLASDMFLTGYEVRPGTPTEVHHVVVYSVDSATELAQAHANEGKDGKPGYTCFGGAMTGGGRTLAVWAPGTGATLYPQGTGIRMKAGEPIILQVHYNKPTVADRTSIDLTLENQVPYEALITGALDLSLNLDPGQANATASATLPIPATYVPYRVWGVYPHMHKLGHTMRVDLFDGTTDRCIAQVPDYNFSWQQFFFYDQPIEVPPSAAGSLSITCGYDTRGATSSVHWGEGTSDEMCIAGLYVTF